MLFALLTEPETVSALAGYAHISRKKPAGSTGRSIVKGYPSPFTTPSPCPQDKGSEHWPIIAVRLCAEDEPRGFILGIEDGWIRYDRSGFLQWPVPGRERYAAGDSNTYTEATGQAVFAFYRRVCLAENRPHSNA